MLLNASRVSGGKTRVMASAWTAPPWMKTNNQFVGGVLRPDMYQAWADYHLRFLAEYAARGVDVWAVTTGNEPINAFFTPLLIRFNSMGWTPMTQRRWLGRHFGPALRRSPFNATKLLALDDQRMLLPWWLDLVRASGTSCSRESLLAPQLAFLMCLHSVRPMTVVLPSLPRRCSATPR